METLHRKRKNFNKIELLPKRWGLPGNTSSWLVLQSFHPPMAGFFFRQTFALLHLYGDGIHLTVAHKREWSYGFKPDNK
ncbi:hypothetical protein ACU6QO_01110, partial [Aeromonas veronii]